MMLCAAQPHARLAVRHLQRRFGMLLMTSLYTSSAFAQLPAGNPILQVENAARAQLIAQFQSAGAVEPEFQLSVVKTPRPAADCTQPLRIDTLDTRQVNRLRFVATCPGVSGWRAEFLVRATVTARVQVTAAPVAAGQALTVDDLAVERRDISSIADSISDQQDALGLSSRRMLRAGEVLRKSQLQTVALIKRGQEVHIVARREQIEVSMTGEALDNGALDSVIKVRNGTSGTVIRARVTGPGQVEPADLAGARN